MFGIRVQDNECPHTMSDYTVFLQIFIGDSVTELLFMKTYDYYNRLQFRLRDYDVFKNNTALIEHLHQCALNIYNNTESSNNCGITFAIDTNHITLTFEDGSIKMHNTEYTRESLTDTIDYCIRIISYEHSLLYNHEKL